ncbi:MAG TPA: fumarylacetoacetate hydrolase family protein [Vicinamibacteria bacterium]|nr:fumarylacetoacetate hydrolase family protein [Vicinamibacteria bacterium]
MIRRFLLASSAATVVMLTVALPVESAVEPVEKFKFGTIELDGAPTLALVLRDRFVVELNKANGALERRPFYAKITMPEDMKELAARYHLELQPRIYQIVNHMIETDQLDSIDRPAYVHDVKDVRVLAPILRPSKILNAAGNYYGHVSEGAQPEEYQRVIAQLRQDRGMPYLFHKLPSAIIGDGDAIWAPKGRPNVDWECEIGVVIGRPARYVTKDEAKDHIFGYTIEIDVSDRGGRGDERFGGSDWLIGKSHDTFAPLGPFVTPAEFIENPMDIWQKLTVNGVLMQDARSSDMIFNIYELIEYGSAITTLESGDVVAAGSTAGTARSLTVRDAPVPFLKPGDVVVASIEGIGSLHHEVIPEPDPPPPLYTGQPSSVKVSEPFKLGTFAIQGAPTLGLVLRDRYVVELEAANQDYELNPLHSRISMARDMKELAGRYHLGLRDRLYEVVNQVTSRNMLDGPSRPSYVHDVASLRTLAPILYPGKILNAAANYYGHVGETGTPEEQAREAEARRRERGIPYLFIKTTSAGVSHPGDDIVMPRGRPSMDWECEIGVVIGQPAKRVSAADAKNYIFGYTIELDMSSRDGRRPGENRSDWFIGKGHDGHAPLGPYIVPAEFIEDPMSFTQKLTVNGKLMQDGSAKDMIHDIYELIEWGSAIVTLEPGDVIGAGSPAGTGMSRSVRPEQIFLKPGDVIVATIDGIGELTHTIKAHEEAYPPRATTDSQP